MRWWWRVCLTSESLGGNLNGSLKVVRNIQFGYQWTRLASRHAWPRKLTITHAACLLYESNDWSSTPRPQPDNSSSNISISTEAPAPTQPSSPSTTLPPMVKYVQHLALIRTHPPLPPPHDLRDLIFRQMQPLHPRHSITVAFPQGVSYRTNVEINLSRRRCLSMTIVIGRFDVAISTDVGVGSDAPFAAAGWGVFPGFVLEGDGFDCDNRDVG